MSCGGGTWDGAPPVHSIVWLYCCGVECGNTCQDRASERRLHALMWAIGPRGAGFFFAGQSDAGAELSKAPIPANNDTLWLVREYPCFGKF